MLSRLFVGKIQPEVCSSDCECTDGHPVFSSQLSLGNDLSICRLHPFSQLVGVLA